MLNLKFNDIQSSAKDSVLGKLPPGKFPQIKLPPGESPPRKFPLEKFPLMFFNVTVAVNVIIADGQV